MVAIGIDSGAKEGSFLVSLKLAIPQGDATQIDEVSQIVTQESSSISEALRRMKSKVEKELDFVHCKTIIIGDKTAEKDIRHILDWAVRRRDIQLILNFSIGRPDALSVLQVKPSSERIPSNALIMAMSGQGTESPFITRTHAYELNRDIFENGKDPVIPIIEAKGKQDFLINKAALFNKSHMSMVLSPDETRLLNLLMRSNLRTNFPADMNGEMYQYYTESSSTSYKILTPRDSVPSIRYTVKIKGILEESSFLEMVTHKDLMKVSAAAEKKLNQNILKLLQKIQKSGLDPLGWGLHYGARHWNNETEMEEWKKLYPQLRFQVDAHVRIKYSGMIK